VSEPVLLAIDNGTQSVRALLFDSEGQLLARSQVSIEAYISREPGWAEQDPGYFWQSLCAACRGLWDQPGVDRTRIRAVALTTQRATVINLDRDGEPLRPAIVWLDQRRVASPPPMGGVFEKLIRLAGQGGTLDYLRSQAECNWIAIEQPQIREATHKFLLLSGFHTWKLCGRFVDALGAQAGFIPFDARRFRWPGAADWRWRAMALRREQLPDLVAAGAELGRITAEAARETGIPEGLPLIAAGADKACEVLGSGCLDPRTGALSFGTTATFNTCNTRYVEALPMIPPYPAAIPGAWNTEIMVQRGFWMLQWFLREFGLREEQEARLRGLPPQQLLDALLAETPPGAMGLTLQPYWSPGIRVPGPEAKGAVIGFGDVHTRAHLYRAIIEGLAYALREAKETVERRNRVRVETLRVSGGGSQSDAVMQITADVFGMPVERPHTFETSGLGAAINAAVGAGIHRDHAAAIARMTHRGRVFNPVAEHTRTYERLYREVYRKMYPRLGSLYRAIQNITGYPA
jgi:sugar (pentulose or hexulose) kinase